MEDAKPRWYTAELVEEFLVEGVEGHLVHINMILVRADSPDGAYERALWFGGGGEDSYENPEGKRVTVRFRGLRSLNPVAGDLEEGDVLTWEEKAGLSEEDVAALVRNRENLGAFVLAERK